MLDWLADYFGVWFFTHYYGTTYRNYHNIPDESGRINFLIEHFGKSGIDIWYGRNYFNARIPRP
jgi:hypothetical protein